MIGGRSYSLFRETVPMDHCIPLDQFRGKVVLRPPRRRREEAVEKRLKRAERRAFLHRFELPPVDVAQLRKRVGMSQTRFARRIGVPVATLRHWEHGDRRPHGAARVLLDLIARNPQAMLRALQPRLRR